MDPFYTFWNGFLDGCNFEIGKGFSVACIDKCFFKMDYKPLADKSLVELLSSSDTLAYNHSK